jgi:hypothetical protein
MFWVLMNVKNPDISLPTADPLPNTGHIVGRREPESRLDAQGLGRHTALTAMVFADVDTTVGLTNRRSDSGASV